MVFINQYSMLWSSLIILALVSFGLLRKGITPQRVLIVFGTAVLLLGSWLTLRPDPASTTELNQFQAELGKGKSLLLELQSPY